eukprot:1536843-Prymnesium_polylepis.2
METAPPRAQVGSRGHPDVSMATEACCVKYAKREVNTSTAVSVKIARMLVEAWQPQSASGSQYC